MRVRFFVVLISLTLATPVICKAAGTGNDLKNSVVKIFVTSNPPNFSIPWQSRGSGTIVGSGTIISGHRILTNAHVMNDQTFIQVKKGAASKKYVAKVSAIGKECDLAILTVEDEEFFEGTTPIPFGELPMLQETVTVLGYPIGGDQLSITEGVVSRIDVINYRNSFLGLLAVQIDAAINPGNSGGAVIRDGKLVGVAFQGFAHTENIGYVVPTLIIRHFLEDLEDGRYDGFPWLGLAVKSSENPTLRQFYKIGSRDGGVLVTKIDPLSPAYGRLKEGDILFEIDGIPVADDGTVKLRTGERLFFTYLIDKRQIGEMLQLRVWREGEEIDLSFKLHAYVPLVPWPSYYERAAYYIYGGFVFTILSSDLMIERAVRKTISYPDLIYYSMGTGKFRSKGRKEIVLLSHVLPDGVNIGYHDIRTEVVDKVNAQPVKSFKEFVMILHEMKEKYVIIDTEQNSRIILDSKLIDEANKRILETYGIPSQFSKDVAVWLESGKQRLTKA